ncbi:MAG TPA: tetratricopeptide repeat protein [Opitutaceae bacterium]|nr:tetratricopeptide repeat protein [Opitutaceae bacterium]
MAATGFVLSRPGNHPSAQSRFRPENLPAQFDQALQRTRDEARAHKNDPERIRKLARLYHANRFYQEARTCYQEIATTRGGLNARDHYYLADIAQNENDLAVAQAELQAVLQTEPGYVPARLALAEALFKSGNADAAGKEYSAVLAIEPNHPQASLGLARIELQRGDEDAAVARLDELMIAHPESTSGAGLFAQVLERRGETDRAIAFSQWSLQKPEPIPPDRWMSELLTDLYDLQRLGLKFEDYFKTGQIAEAAPFLRRIEELDPQSAIPSLLRGWSEAQAHRDQEAVQQYRLALTKGGDPEKICPYLIQSLLKLGNVSEAAKLMADYSAKMPDSLPIAKAYSEVAIRQGSEKLARELLTKILEKEPYLQSENMSLAKILWSSGERDAAAKCLQRVAAVYAKDVPSRALLGEYYLGKADPFSAIKPLEQASAQVTAKTPAKDRLTALLGAAYFQAGNAETEKGRFAEAADSYEKASRIAPADLNAYAGKANACVQLQQFARAAEALEKMSTLQPANPTIHLSLGDVRYQAGEKDQARRHWQKARQLVAAGDAELGAALEQRLSGRITAETFK